MSQEITAATALVTGLIGGIGPAQVTFVAAELRLPDLLADGRGRYDDLAASAGAAPRAVYRLLRAMAAIGLAEDCGEGFFALTPAGQLLRTGVPGSLRGMALHAGTMLWLSWGDLAESVRTGKVAASRDFGPEGFVKLSRDPEAGAVFYQSMVDGSRRIARDAADAYDFGRFSSICDVGGGYGAVLAVLLQAYPTLTGSVFDLPGIASSAGDFLRNEGVAARGRFEGGDFFAEIPAGADCYVLKYIIHDWSDEPARAILTNCARAAGKDGTVVLLERVVPDRIVADPAHRSVIMGDLTMLLCGGAERTESEYHTLFAEAGLRLTRLVPMASGFSVIEAKPV